MDTPLLVDSPWPSQPAKSLFERQRRASRDGDGIVTAFRDGEVTLRSNRRTQGFTNAVQEHGYQGVRRGDLVIHSMDGFAGAIGVSDSDGKSSPVVHCYRPRETVDPRFYAYLLRDLARAGFVTSLAKGIRERSTAFDSEAFRSLVLPVPPRDEQRAIADYLDTETARIDALITKKRRMIKLLEERWVESRRATILGELDPVHGRQSSVHETLNLGILIELQRGHDLPSDDRVEGPVPIVSSGGVSGFHNAAQAVGPGVITGRYGTIGEVFYVDGEYWPLNTTLYVKDFRGNHPRWVYHALAALPLDVESAKSAVTGINRNVIGALRIPKPPHSSQVGIACGLDEEEEHIKELSTRVQAQLDLLTERRQALITAAVTGELEIPGVAA